MSRTAHEQGVEDELVVGAEVTELVVKEPVTVAEFDPVRVTGFVGWPEVGVDVGSLEPGEVSPLQRKHVSQPMSLQ
jgi:hypothetical protein